MSGWCDSAICNCASVSTSTSTNCSSFVFVFEFEFECVEPCNEEVLTFGEFLEGVCLYCLFETQDVLRRK